MKLWLAAVALALGTLAGACLAQIPLLHGVAGHLFGRGELVALVRDKGIFTSDVQAKQHFEGGFAAARARLIAETFLQGQASAKTAGTEHLMAMLRAQFADDTQMRKALLASGISRGRLRRMLNEMVAGEHWIEKRIAAASASSAREERSYFEGHQEEFQLPARLRVRHIFFAAPALSSPEIVAAKKKAAGDVLARLTKGEDFAHLAAVFSEDEASKPHGGDLGFLAANRTPPELWTAIAPQRVLAPPVIVQSHLGLHVLQVTAAEPAGELSQPQTEVTMRVNEAKRRQELLRLERELVARSQAILLGPQSRS